MAHKLLRPIAKLANLSDQFLHDIGQAATGIFHPRKIPSGRFHPGCFPSGTFPPMKSIHGNNVVWFCAKYAVDANLSRLESSILTRAKRATNRSNVGGEYTGVEFFSVSSFLFAFLAFPSSRNWLRHQS